ncbi:Brix domain-containing protein [Candidatus Bathyarchaeota archaeon]|nr:Brix domain-containing protein [Candidatus Bathyarchaeota archaeon]
MILVTTGRNPTQATRRLSSELARYLPGTTKLVRGKLSLRQITDHLAAAGITRLVLVYRGAHGPGQIELMRLEGNELKRVPPTIFIQNIEFTPPGRGRSVVKVDSVTVGSQQLLPLAKALSNFLDLPLTGGSPSDFKYSLHLSCGRRGAARPILSLPGGEANGLKLTVKELEW